MTRVIIFLKNLRHYVIVLGLLYGNVEDSFFFEIFTYGKTIHRHCNVIQGLMKYVDGFIILVLFKKTINFCNHAWFNNTFLLN